MTDYPSPEDASVLAWTSIDTDAISADLKARGGTEFKDFTRDRKVREAELAEAGDPRPGMRAYMEIAVEYGCGPDWTGVSDAGGVPVSDAGFEKSLFEGKTCTFGEVMEFVSSNIFCSNVTPEKAPSAQAWNILMIAKEDARTFFVEWIHMQAKRNDAELEKLRIEHDARVRTDEINKMLDGLASLQEGSEDG